MPQAAAASRGPDPHLRGESWTSHYRRPLHDGIVTAAVSTRVPPVGVVSDQGRVTWARAALRG